MSKSIEDLREALFATLEGVKNGTIDTDRARAVNELGKTLCDTAKVELEFLKQTDGEQSHFLAPSKQPDPLPPGITGVTVHRLKG